MDNIINNIQSHIDQNSLLNEQKNNEDCSPVTELHPVYRLQQDVSDGREHGLQFKCHYILWCLFIYCLILV